MDTQQSEMSPLQGGACREGLDCQAADDGDGHPASAPPMPVLQSVVGVLQPKAKPDQFSILDRISPEELRVIIARATPGFPVIDDVYRVGVRRWFVVYTHPRCENKVRETCKRVGFDTYMPLGADWKPQTRKEIQQNKPKEQIRRPVLTRYIFIQMPVDLNDQITPFGLVRKIDGVGGFVGTSDGPLVLRDEHIETIRGREKRGEFDVTKMAGRKSKTVVPKWLQVGGKVEVDDGPFATLRAIIEDILPNERLKVVVDFLGRPTPVELELAQVRQIR